MRTMAARYPAPMGIPGVGVHLHDTAPIDLVLSSGYLLTLALTIVAARRSLHDTTSRWIWFGIYLMLALLLVNQQSDIHNPVFGGIRDRLSGLGIPLMSFPVLVAFGLLLGACGLGAFLLLTWLRAWGHAPGTLASAGLVLLSTFVLVRGARMMHVLQGDWADEGLLYVLKIAELMGLALVSWGAWVWRAPVPLRAVASTPPMR